MFKDAYEGGYAIGAFNVNNMEIIQGIVQAAAKLNAPVILQVSAGARKYANHTYLTKLVEAAEMETGLPIALHLDHGPDFETCKSCIDGGFTSVMIDGSHHPYEDNVALTKQVVDYAHVRGVTVEGELGQLAGVEDDVDVSAEDASYTNPEQVYDFVTRTGVDSLAIAIGTSHGAFKFNPVKNRRCVSISLRRSNAACPVSRSCFTVRVPWCRSLCVKSMSSRRTRRRHRHSGRHVAPSRLHGGVQNQHRLGPASGDDGGRTQVPVRKSVAL
jgi:ketose-bisphosphate aldolase